MRIMDKARQDQTGQDMKNGQPDVATILSELREQIKERQARLAVDDPNDPHALNLAELKRSVEAVNDTWFVSAHLPITWDKRIVGRLGAHSKRAVRVLSMLIWSVCWMCSTCSFVA